LITITIAKEEHLPQILRILRETISPEWTYDAFLSEMQKSDSLFLVAVDETGEPSPCLQPPLQFAAPSSTEEDYTVVGFAVFRQVGDDGELLQIAVDGAVRRRGVGDSLMTTTLDYAKTNALNSVFLEVREGNVAAVRLYRKHGFEIVRVRKDYYNNPVEDALVMIKNGDKNESI